MSAAGQPWRIAAMYFDHMHIGGQLQVIRDHPGAELVGVFSMQPERTRRVCSDLGVPESLQHTDPDGVTLAGRLPGGEIPLEVTTTQFIARDFQLSAHSVVGARYRTGLSTFQTRWGTFTDPWSDQPQPHCGFTVAGTAETATSSNHAGVIRVQNDEPEGIDIAVDASAPHERTALGYLLHCLERGLPVEGPTGWETSRAGQRIVDAALLSAERRAPVELAGLP